MTKVTKQVIFKGQVQGVGFRFTAYSVAKRYLLNGYVKNLPDGTVEIILQGTDDSITACIRDLQDTYIVRETKINEITQKEHYSELRKAASLVKR